MNKNYDHAQCASSNGHHHNNNIYLPTSYFLPCLPGVVRVKGKTLKQGYLQNRFGKILFFF